MPIAISNTNTNKKERIMEETGEVKSFSIKTMKKSFVSPLHTYPKIVLWTTKRFYFPFQNASFIPVTITRIDFHSSSCQKGKHYGVNCD